ncbi:alpha/beta hydrolase [Plantibacter flavus]|uniref:alpha/beta fold hydrolase n=1 Tax=Plantibacter flavus TaxID=150123 RepID=UPI003F169314
MPETSADAFAASSLAVRTISPVALPRYRWGRADAPAKALVVHGLGSNGPSTWRLCAALADRGWRVDAIDLRGHGFAPRSLDYRIEAYAADLLAARPDEAASSPWNLVIGHSLGGAATAVTAAADPRWTNALVLLDPAIHLDEHDAGVIRASQEAAFAENTEHAVRAKSPDWHPVDVELKVQAVAQASRWAIEQTSAQNEPWDVRAAAAALGVPTLVVAADPHVYSLFRGSLAAEVLANPRVSMTIIQGAGHNVHRDRPAETTTTIGDWAALQLEQGPRRDT